MKKTLIIFIIAVFALAPAFSVEGNRTTLSIGEAMAVTEIGVSHNFGCADIGAEFLVGFPNMFISALIENPSGIGDNLMRCLKMLNGIEIYADFDVISNPRHDLNLGIGVQTLYQGESKSVLISSNARLGYTYNFRNNHGISFETSFPFFHVGFKLSDPKGTFGYSFATPQSSYFMALGLNTRLSYKIRF